jgi:hypothetical protein
MPILRLQAAVWQDSLEPRDAMVINPHFNVSGAFTDANQLCADLADALVTYYTAEGQIRVRSYDAQGTVPVYPNGEATRQLGLSPASTVNRDVALVLSFYAGENRPRQRGRLYIPCSVTGIAATSARPTTTQQQKVADLVPILANLGGINVQWCVYSRVDDQARQVTNWWVDNAWDSQRRRGLRPTSRLLGAMEG